MEEIEGLKLTTRMRRVLHAAAGEARKRGHDFIGTEHMLLGLLDEPDGLAAKVLEQLGAARPARERLETIFDSLGYRTTVEDPGLREELLRRRELDQAPRQRNAGQASIGEMRRISEENATWLKGVISERGWPGRRLVGNDGADAAWLFAQHADHDLEFQRECLRLLEKALSTVDVLPRHVAYLTDRILINEGEPQRYGTQFQGSEPFPIENPEDVDQRRAAMGLEPLAEYAKRFQRYSGMKQDPWLERLGRELDWWRDFLHSRLQDDPEYQQRFDPERPLQPEIVALLPAGVDPEHVRILDCASGPASALGRTINGRAIKLLAVDALAQSYHELLADLGLKPPVDPIPGTAEQLDRMFPDAPFDLVYMSNALDHCREPELALQQMLSVTKQGGVVVIEHYNHDARRFVPEALPGAQIDADYSRGRMRVVIRKSTG